MPLNENQFGLPAKPRYAFNRLRDASGLVAGRNDNRDHVGLPSGQTRAASNEKNRETEPAEERRDAAIYQTAKRTEGLRWRRTT